MIRPLSNGARLGIAAAFFVAGFLFPPFFILAVVVVWTLFADRRRSEVADAGKWHVRRWIVTSADEDWVSCFLPFCESPAETAFLEAMIPAFDLKPEQGILKSDNLKLDLQVQIGSYRVDFLANDWLVIEIDGAAYHSSPEALAKDNIRDQRLRSDGYAVLRIPAKVVFGEPDDAVGRVSAAMLSGRIPRKRIGDALRAVSLPSAKGMLAGLAGVAEQFSSHMATTLAVQEAMKPVELAFAREKSVFDAAMKRARHKIEMEEFRKQHRLDQELMDQARLDLDEAIQRRGGSARRLSATVELPVIVRPSSHREPSIDAAIQRHFDGLMTVRSQYYAEISGQIESDSRLPNLIRSALQELDHGHFWDLFVSQCTRQNNNSPAPWQEGRNHRT